jgi:CRISPR-associated protein Cas2
MSRSPFDPADWRQALDAWTREHAPADAPADWKQVGQDPRNWWNASFPNPPTPSETRGHPCGEKEMLTIVAYDICDAKRLRHVAQHCENYGVRVQYSIFECRLEATRFECFWRELRDLIDPAEDRLVAYAICARCAREIFTAGNMVSNTPPPVAYVF